MARKRPAKKVKKTKITAWSFSRWYTYDRCPNKLSFQVHHKLKEPPNAAMKRGIEVHNKAEDYVTKKTNRMAPELKNFADDFKDLRNHPAVKCEDQWCFDAKWGEQEWFSKQAWLRVKMDAHHPIIEQYEHPEAWAAYNDIMGENAELLDGGTHRAIDFKTGKPNPTLGELQTSLYALSTFKLLPDVQAVLTELWFLDSGEIVESVYLREDLKLLEKEWKDRTKKMLNDTRFDPTPGSQCKWCHFSKQKGGPCSAG